MNCWATCGRSCTRASTPTWNRCWRSPTPRSSSAWWPSWTGRCRARRPSAGWAWPSRRSWRTTPSTSITTAPPPSPTAARCSTRSWITCGCGPATTCVAWNLQPVVLAHEVLVRCGREAAAESWRQAVAERTADIADEHLKRFARLEPQVRHAAAEHRRAAGGAVPAAVGGGSALRPGAAGDRGAARRRLCGAKSAAGSEGAGSPRGRARFAVWKKGSPSLPAKSRGPDSTCRPGWRPCSRKSIGCSRRPPRKRSCPVPNCPSRKSCSPGKRFAARCGRSTAADRRGCAILENSLNPQP